MGEKREKLWGELSRLLNWNSMEHAGGDTPDIILAEFLLDVLEAFGTAVWKREVWYGRGKVKDGKEGEHE